MSQYNHLHQRAQLKPRFALATAIASVLKRFGRNIRPVYYGVNELPKGGLNALIRQRPPDAVRCELLGATLTIEITGETLGEQQKPDAVLFGCTDFETFQTWFYHLLQLQGYYTNPY